jgi:hypothetical protein
MATTYYKVENSKVIFTGDGELIYFVPEKYFDCGAATVIGELVESMGIFSYGLYDKNGKQLKIARFKCPTMFECRPSSISKEKGFQLINSKTAKDYRLLHFKKGDELICNTNIPKDVENVEKFVNLLIGGHLPDDIPYNEVHEYIIKNAELNGFNYKVSGQTFGILVGVIYRSMKDLSVPYRNSDYDKNMLDYKAISIKEVPKYTSPYTAITSENADEAIAAAMTMTKSSGDSPLEKVMMG